MVIKSSCICHSADVYHKIGPCPRIIQKLLKCFIFSKNLTKKVKCPYADHHETLMKETGEEINKWKGILCSWQGKLVLLKCLI